MGGHKDDATGEDQTAPVLSLSMGATAVFLLGGEDKDHPPQPLLLRGGDIMVLAGAARTCLHGVPRVLVPEHGHAEGDIQAEQGSQEARALTRFLASSRINITVRATA
jgi:alkylated DNA repair protein alkB family protein 1